ncbi:unnamed protein product [Eretmochelys imbricata]
MRVATTGSAGLDLIMQEDADFRLPGEVCAIPTQVTGPLPAGFVGLVLPRSHTGKQGFFVIPGVIDADYTGVIKVQVWTHLPQSLPHGRSIAQLIIVPYQVPATEEWARGGNGFGSTLSQLLSHNTSSPLVALTMSLCPSKPQLTLLLNNVPFTGLVDIGADVTVIRDQEWPVSWPTVPSKELWGIGGSKPGRQSLSWITISKTGGRALATIRPFVLPVHLNIWGRDLLVKLDTTLDINI